MTLWQYNARPTGTEIYCLMTEARVCEQLAQCRYLAVKKPGDEPVTSAVPSQCLNHYTTWRFSAVVASFVA